MTPTTSEEQEILLPDEAPKTLDAHLITFIVQHGVWTPLGSISFAGFVAGSRGLQAQNITKRVLGSYALIYTVSGSCNYWDRLNGDRRLQAGDMLIIFPEVEHYYAPNPGERWDEYFIHFNGPIFDLWRQHGLLDPRNPVLHAEPTTDWLTRMMACNQKGERIGTAEAMHQICMLQVLLSDLNALQQHHAAPSPTGSKWIEAACRLLGDGLINPIDFHALAAQFGLSYEYFRKHFTIVIGMSPNQYRLARCIDRASELLIQENLGNKQIAAQLGFCDEYHFSKRFKQVTGVSPRQFRKQMVGERE